MNRTEELRVAVNNILRKFDKDKRKHMEHSPMFDNVSENTIDYVKLLLTTHKDIREVLISYKEVIK